MNNNPRRNTEPEMIDVLQASIFGKQIQRRLIIGLDNEWENCRVPIEWRFRGYQYRIAPLKPVGVNTLVEINTIVEAALDFRDLEYTATDNPVDEGYLPFDYGSDDFRFDQFHYRIKCS
jgi:hypothetical protein